MSKKAVIVPNHKWVAINDNDYCGVFFYTFPTRNDARANSDIGKVRKVTKIVYYWE